MDWWCGFNPLHGAFVFLGPVGLQPRWLRQLQFQSPSRGFCFFRPWHIVIVPLTMLVFQSPSRGFCFFRSRIKNSSQLSLAIFYLIFTLDCTNPANAARLNDILVPFDGKSCRSYAYEALEFTRFLHSTLLRTFCEQYSLIMWHISQTI